MTRRLWPVLAALLVAEVLVILLAPPQLKWAGVATVAVVAGSFAGAAVRRRPATAQPPIAVFATADLLGDAPVVRSGSGKQLNLVPEETVPVLRRKSRCLVLGTIETGERVAFSIQVPAEQFDRAERVTDPEAHRALVKAFAGARAVIAPEPV